MTMLKNGRWDSKCSSTVAVKPSSSCMKMGSRNMLAISMANITAPISVPLANTGSLKSRRFTTGALAVSSRMTNAARPKTAISTITVMTRESNQLS